MTTHGGSGAGRRPPPLWVAVPPVPAVAAGTAPRESGNASSARARAQQVPSWSKGTDLPPSSFQVSFVPPATRRQVPAARPYFGTKILTASGMGPGAGAVGAAGVAVVLLPPPLGPEARLLRPLRLYKPAACHTGRRKSGMSRCAAGVAMQYSIQAVRSCSAQAGCSPMRRKAASALAALAAVAGAGAPTRAACGRCAARCPGARVRRPTTLGIRRGGLSVGTALPGANIAEMLSA
mmetsp:Transcript_148993/g.415191  ORF Transcript_148993/g.415191 Transcript_148993/m.415191 type:complete len:236 (-) Transcript_148993:129-836(-)